MRADRRKYHYIYKTTCIPTGRWYIGMHSTDDLNDGYVGSGKRLWHSINKYGKDQHRIEILEYLPDRKSLTLREEQIVNSDMLKNPMCMNLAPGGEGGMTRMPRTNEWKAKISAAHRGKTMPREAVEKQRAKMAGYKWSDEQVQKRVEGQLTSEKFKERYRPIIIDGVTYQNGREAVAALGIPGGTIANRLKSPNWLNYRYADQPEKDPTKVSKRARGEYTRD